MNTKEVLKAQIETYLRNRESKDETEFVFIKVEGAAIAPLQRR